MEAADEARDCAAGIVKRRLWEGDGAKNPGRRRGIFGENAHFVHEEMGFLRGAAHGFSSICNLETF
jgi:hypothetical protein